MQLATTCDDDSSDMTKSNPNEPKIKDSELCIEETSLGELDISENTEDTQKKHAISTVALGFDKASAPVFGSVSVNSSENVQFGNNTYFNGPVVIKQIVHAGKKAGVDNASYLRTEVDGDQHMVKPQHRLDEKGKIVIKTWHKLALLMTGLFIIVGTSTAVLLRGNALHGSDMLPDEDYTDDSTNSSNNNPLQIAPFHLRLVSRSEWLAQPVEKPLDVIQHPVPWVIITHTAAENCSTQSECVLRVRLIQMFHMESRGWYDIGYNFLVGGDGSAYIGRGWDYVGAHTKGYNLFSIGIAFIGTFNKDPPPEQQLAACQKLLAMGVRLGKLSPEYRLFAHRQLWSTQSPGDATYDIIKKWPHFETNVTASLPKS